MGTSPAQGHARSRRARADRPGDQAPHHRYRRAPHRLVHRARSLQTVDLVSEEGGFDYISDTYDDDLPYWCPHKGRAQLIIPYTLAANDMRFVTAPGFDNGEEYFQFLKDSFDVLYEEGRLGASKTTSWLHRRLVGMPGRFAGLKRFVMTFSRGTRSGSPAASTSPDTGPSTTPTRRPTTYPPPWIAPSSSAISAPSSSIRLDRRTRLRR